MLSQKFVLAFSERETIRDMSDHFLITKRKKKKKNKEKKHARTLTFEAV